MALVHERVLLRQGDGGVCGAGFVKKHAAHVALGLAHYHWDAGLDDAGFLTGYLCQRVAQKLGVVERDVGDHAQHGGDDVGAVEPSAQAHLNHCIVHIAFLEVVKCHGRGEFEETGVTLVARGKVALHEVDHLLLWYHLAIHPDALSEVDDVGRGVEAHFVPGLLQHGGEQVSDRAFAVGACHVYALVGSVRVAK